MLIEEGIISSAQLEEALAIKKERGGFLGGILVEMKYIAQDTLINFLVKQCKIPHLSLLDYHISEDVLKLIPEEVCLSNGLLPIDKLGRILTVAMVDPLDVTALEEVRKACPDLRIKPILCSGHHFEAVAAQCFGKKAGGPAQEVSAGTFGLAAAPVSAQAPALEKAPAEEPLPDDLLDAAVQSLIAEAKTAEQDLPPPAKPEGTIPVPRPRQTEAASPAAVAGITAEELAGTMRSALQEAIGAMAGEMRAALAEAQPAPGIDTTVLADAIQSSVRNAILESMPKVAAPEPAKEVSAPAPPSLESMAEVFRDTLGGTLQEMVAAITVQVKAALSQQSASSHELADHLREAIAPLAEHFARQEEATVSETARRDLHGEAAPVVRSHASVTPFGRNGLGEIERELADRDTEIHYALEAPPPLTGFTFESFLPGKANAFTFALAQQVAATPGGEHNPFFLYGNVGLGKTHLVNATGNAILATNPKARVGYVSASRFATALMEAEDDKAVAEFRSHYSYWDVLILDDIQFLGGRVSAQEELFHIFNAFQQGGRQIIIAGDKAPDKLGLLEQRLVSRFAGGIVANVKPPEFETRVAILSGLAARARVKVPGDIVSLIAMRVPGDMRKMTGSLRKILAFAQHSGQDMTCELATEILSHLGIEDEAA